MPVATVIIPCGPRHIPLLPRAIASAQQQSLPVSVLWYIDQDKRGPGYARNRMAAQVATPFIVQLDADDYLLPSFVETSLRHWQPGTYTYSDWYEGEHHIRATPCYGMRRGAGPNQRDFHLPPTLFPTALWRAIGGYDETLFGAEDTAFFFKANSRGIRAIHIHEPLFHYTPDGFRAREAASDPRWGELLKTVFGQFKGKMSMACCGDVKVPEQNPGVKQDGDVWARYTQNGRSRVFGARSGRFYGRIAFPWTGWVDPRDVDAQPHLWERVPDTVALSPSGADIQRSMAVQPAITDEPLTTKEAIERRIVARGIRTDYVNYTPAPGYDIQQNPSELAAFLLWCVEHGVQSVLEIGTGESGGLARFLAVDMGWQVTSVDPQRPADVAEGVEFILADSANVDLSGREWDVVFIDGDHTYDAVRRDHERFADQARLAVAFHDVVSSEAYAEGVNRYWHEIAYTTKGNLRSRHHEVGEQFGIGWYERA